uniref:Glucose-methanol-choline oxidoreductase N-terminal domain-containing protein n=1 Tax=Timema cristinae TaxID=61476 RepID=A0A7R9GPF6_TIMCR|nr:unnamed protein product [Timema cristinae]
MEVSKNTSNEIEKYDFIIVGGGSAGCVLANRLSEEPSWKVVLLEAGGEEPELADVPAFMPFLQGNTSKLDWAYQTRPDLKSCAGTGCAWPRGKVLGGSSVLNGMLYVRGNRRDYDFWEKLGNKGWGYEDVLKYFIKSEDNRDHFLADPKYHGVGGYQSVERFPYQDVNVRALIEAFKELGYKEVDFNAERQEGVMRAQTTSFKGERQSTNSAFLKPVRDSRPNLKVITHAQVTRILIDTKTKRAQGVEYVLNDNKKEYFRIYVNKEVILSAGALGSPHLLMLSGIGPTEYLQPLRIPVIQDLSVGYNLQDHVSSSGVHFMLSNKTTQVPQTLDKRLGDLDKYFQESKGPLTATGVLQVVAYAKSQYARVMDDYPDIQPTVLRPRSRGILIINSTDPFTRPHIHPNYFSDRLDMEILIEGLLLGVQLSQTKVLRDLGYTLNSTPLPSCAALQFGSFPYWRCVIRQYTQTIYHPAGTCKMGPRTDRNAVVDPELQVYGIINLRVVDASIMPYIVRAAALLGTTKLWFLPTFLATLAYYHYDLFDPENRVVNEKNLRSEYDFIIIGGGSAGSVLANRLTEIPQWNVLLIEAGGDEPEIADVPILSLYLHKSKLDWKYRTQTQPNACQAMEDKRCCWTRGKVLGGSSVLNTMLYVRGNRRDFDQWEELGNRGWSYEDVLPYFKKSQDQRNPYLAKNKRFHATGGYLTVQDSPWGTPLGPAFIQAGVEMGYEHKDINGYEQTGFAFYQYTMRRGYRCSTAKAFLRPIRLRKNLHIAMWTHVTKILIDEETKRAYGVEFIRGLKKQTVLASKEVILSAGSINSPQLLMLSGVGPAQHLQELGIPVIHDSPGVGQNLMDHIATPVVFLIDHPISLVIDRVVNLNTALRYAYLGDGPLTSSVGLEVVAFINTKYANASDDWPDIEFMLSASSTNSDGGTQVRKAHGITQNYYDEVFGNITNLDVFGIFPMILRPKSRGYLKLGSRDPMVYPLLYHNYLTHPADIAVLREGVKTAIAVGETMAMKRFGARLHSTKVPGCKHLELYTDEYWECAIRQYTMTIYHMSGTAKMGPITDPGAVVDAELRVYGVQGLRVIDASIMPAITSGNINAPVIMIAEKGADMVKSTWLRTLKRKRRRRKSELT